MRDTVQYSTVTDEEAWKIVTSRNKTKRGCWQSCVLSERKFVTFRRLNKTIAGE